MRSNKIFRLLGIAAILTILTACTDDDLIENYEVEEGRPIELKLNFKATAPKVVVSSRAELKDNAVNDLYVFIFKEDGSLRTKQYYTGDELTTAPTGSQPNTTTEDNWVKIKTTTGTSRIYAIANVQASVNIYTVDEGESLKTQLDGITTEDGLRELQLNILNNSVNRLSEFLVMAGAVENGANCTIGITKNSPEKLVVKLRRLDSEINFKFEAGKKTYNDENGEHPYCKSFEVTSYQVFNVPNKTYVLGRDNNNNYKNLKEYYIDTADHDELDAATTYSEEEGETTDFFHTEAVTTASNSFTFYMAENRKQAKTGEGTKIDGYEDRELEIKASDEDKENDENEENEKTSVRRTYVNAPDNGTYVLVTGKFFGYSDKYVNDTDNKQYSGEAEANVRYIIHLGGEDPEVANQMDFDNFDIFRNSKYTYNVTVNGVNDIVVEVVTETEENAPGAEGEVLFVNGSQKYILDAHYETVLLAFNRNQLQTGNSTNASEFFTYQIKTPYASYTSTYNNPYTGAKDEDWIRITRNEIDKETQKYSTDLGNYPDGKNIKYLTVQEFIEELKNIASDENSELWDKDKNVVYTCHINEFYYQNNPVDGKKASWKEFVNKPNREVHILNQVKDSGDKLSSIVSSAYVISQRSIQTFYATDKTESYSAYGAETINETDALANYEYYKSQINQWTNTDWNDGRNNFKSILSKIIPALDDSKEWSTYVDETTNGYKESNLQNLPIVNAMKGGYERAYLACMQRNRDLDGDGHISDDEIRWYLPAQNQYVGMFLGEPGLSPESRLYPYNEQDYQHIHYVSSTVYDDNNDENDGLVVYWAEEAVSTSHGKQDTYADDDCWKMNHDHNNHQYRCMRNLYDGKEVDLNNADAPKNFYKVEANTTDGIAGYNITVPYLNKASLRTELIGFGDLAIHRDDDPIKSRVATDGFYTGKKIDGTNFNDWNVYKIAYATSTGETWSNEGNNRPYKIERPTQPEGKKYYLTFIQGNGGWEGTLQIAGESGLWDVNHDNKITCGFAAGTKDDKELTAEEMRQAYVDWMIERNTYTSDQIETVKNLDTNGDFNWNTGVFEHFYDFDNGIIKEDIFRQCDIDEDGELNEFKDITLTITGDGTQLKDSNADGIIDSKDIDATHKFYDPNGTENINQLVFNYCDTNKDGKLTKDDITNDIKRIMIDGPAIEGNQYNDLWDMNMDGIITGGIYFYKWNGNNHQDIMDFEKANGYQGDIDDDGPYSNYFDPNGPYGIKKNIFDQCDINKDGVLDVNDIPADNYKPVDIDMNLYTITGLNTDGKATDYKTPCYYIKDENGNYGKWRVPNLRELYLMLVAENDVDEGGKGIITGGEVSRTQFRFADKKSTDSGEKRFGWYTNGKEKLNMNPELNASVDDDIEQRYHDVDIRCIRDNNAPAISALSE